MTRQTKQSLSLFFLLALAAGLMVFAHWYGAHTPATPAAPAAPAPLPARPEAGFQGNGDAAPLFGYVPDRQATEQFIRSLGPRPDLKTRAPGLFGHDDDQPVLLYRALYEAYAATHGGQWIVDAQEIGDCVSWGGAHSVDIAGAVLWKLNLSATWKPAATEALYGGSRVEARGVSQGGYRDGSNGGWLAKFVRDYGVVFREQYPTVDLTHYSGQRAKDWGNFGCGGRDDNGRLDALCKQHPVRDVALVTTFNEAAAAIRSGYPVAVCSGQGFSRKRDADGFAAGSGNWAHCMCFIGVRTDREGLLCLNSWGPNWISGPKWPADMPDGSFWVDRRTAERMLAGRDSFAFSGFAGFPYRKLDHGAWVLHEPDQVELYTRQLHHSAAEPSYALAP